MLLSGTAESQANVVIDGLSVRRGPRGGEVVDLQIRNSGTAVAYLQQARFIVQEARSIPFCPHPSPMSASYTYRIEFPHRWRRVPFVVEDRLDQVIRRDGVDRFRLSLGADGPGIRTTIYHASLVLRYNGDRETDARQLVLALDNQMKPAGAYIPGLQDSHFRQCVKRSMTDALAVFRLPGVRSASSRSFQRAATANMRAIERIERRQRVGRAP